jgi:tetratricopeptide (TPR) repeat protein
MNAARMAAGDAQQAFARANDLYRHGRIEEAAMLCEALLANGPRQVEFQHLLAFIRSRQGRHDEAVRLMQKVVKLRPGQAEALYHLGNFLLAHGRREEAIASFDRALAINPRAAEVHMNRGNAFLELGRIDEAIACYDRALAVDPGDARARTNRYICYLKQLRDIPFTVAEGQWVARESLRDVNAAQPAAAVSAFRLKHDLEQCAWLMSAGPRFEGIEQVYAVLQSLHSRHMNMAAGQGGGGDSIALVSPAEVEAVGRWRNTLQIAAQPEAIPHFLNPDNDWEDIERRYLAGRPEIVYIDEFLSPQALAAFRRYCLASTFWKTEYANQYLGTFFDTGFVSPLQMEIGLDLQRRLPRIFGGQTLEETWAFKYDSAMDKGIGIHADFARVNLNFWLTPDEANLDPASGGLVVYDVPSPSDWSPEDYNANSAKMYAYLKESGAKAVTVPHRCNRAVLFNSALFHETDTIRFKEGYENRRINVTYLFGRALRQSGR